MHTKASHIKHMKSKRIFNQDQAHLTTKRKVSKHADKKTK
jgi:hypothetical protein